MKFAIRDDDACYFTQPVSLERVYRDIWDRVPVCLATVPFAIGYERVGIPRQHWHSGEAFPLEQNGELVAALKRRLASRQVTVALHGYTHEDFHDGFEFQAAPDPERRIREGLQHQFRIEAINALNHAQFLVPNTTPSSTAFGQVTGTWASPRTILFAMKFLF